MTSTPIRPETAGVVKLLSSDRGELVETGVRHAAVLFEQTQAILFADKQDDSEIVSLRTMDPTELHETIRIRFQVFADAGLLPTDLVGVSLTDAEKRILADALLGHVVGVGHLAAQAIMALTHSEWLDAIPTLTKALRNDTRGDGQVDRPSSNGYRCDPC